MNMSSHRSPFFQRDAKWINSPPTQCLIQEQTIKNTHDEYHMTANIGKKVNMWKVRGLLESMSYNFFLDLREEDSLYS